VVAAFVVAGAGSATAVELRRVETAATARGAEAVLVLSGPVRPTVRALTDSAGRPLRLNVDLPRGTRLSPAVPRALAAAAPLAGVRIGMAEAGSLRVALELEDVASYAVERRGSVVTVAVTGDVAAAAPPAASTPARLVSRCLGAAEDRARSRVRRTDRARRASRSRST
jgi:hypothetical protein